MQLRHGKTPTQTRALERVERVLTGAADVFAERGYAKATTNRIAERAGVHVPSVYQYFANKDALLAELWDRHVGELMDLLAMMIADPSQAPIAETAKLYVSAMLDMHAAKPELFAVLYAQAPRLAGVRDVRAEATALLSPYLEYHRSSLRPTDLKTAAFVLAAAVEGVARQAVIPPAPSRQSLIGELTALVTHYLGV